jgi:hypothetical protein
MTDNQIPAEADYMQTSNTYLYHPPTKTYLIH